MKEKYDTEYFTKVTGNPEDRIFLALVAIANELAEMNGRNAKRKI